MRLFVFIFYIWAHFWHGSAKNRAFRCNPVRVQLGKKAQSANSIYRSSVRGGHLKKRMSENSRICFEKPAIVRQDVIMMLTNTKALYAAFKAKYPRFDGRFAEAWRPWRSYATVNLWNSL
jgi:hypothetical protein